MKNSSSFEKLCQKALNYLAQREQTQSELTTKLLAAGYSENDINRCLTDLVAQGYQSDQRYIEHFIRSAIHKGKGPIRIRYELSSKGLSDLLIAQGMQDCHTNWTSLAEKVFNKKFNSANLLDIKTKAKCIRFMQYRGFESSHYQSFLA